MAANCVVLILTFGLDPIRTTKCSNLPDPVMIDANNCIISLLISEIAND